MDSWRRKRIGGSYDEPSRNNQSQYMFFISWVMNSSFYGSSLCASKKTAPFPKGMPPITWSIGLFCGPKFLTWKLQCAGPWLEPKLFDSNAVYFGIRPLMRRRDKSSKFCLFELLGYPWSYTWAAVLAFHSQKATRYAEDWKKEGIICVQHTCILIVYPS